MTTTEIDRLELTSRYLEELKQAGNVWKAKIAQMVDRNDYTFDFRLVIPDKDGDRDYHKIILSPRSGDTTKFRFNYHIDKRFSGGHDDHSYETLEFDAASGITWEHYCSLDLFTLTKKAIQLRKNLPFLIDSFERQQVFPLISDPDVWFHPLCYDAKQIRQEMEQKANQQAMIIKPSLDVLVKALESGDK